MMGSVAKNASKVVITKEMIPSSSKENLPTSSKINFPASSKLNLPASSHENIPASSRENIPLSSKENIPSTSKETLPTLSKDTIQILTKDSIPSAISQNKYIVIEFYTTWCTSCLAFAPEYEKIIQLLSNNKKLYESGVAIILAKVDCTDDLSISEEYHVDVYPTIRFYKYGELIRYQGGLEAGELAAWLIRKIGPAIKELKTFKDVEDFLKNHPVAVIGFFREMSTRYLKVFAEAGAQSMQIFAFTSSKDACNYYRTKCQTVILFKNFDEGMEEYKQSFTQDKITKFVDLHSLPLVVNYDQKTPNFYKYPLLFVYLFMHKDFEGFDVQMEEARRAAPPFREKAVILFSDLGADFCRGMFDYFGLEDKGFPLVLGWKSVSSRWMYCYELNEFDFIAAEEDDSVAGEEEELKRTESQHIRREKMEKKGSGNRLENRASETMGIGNMLLEKKVGAKESINKGSVGKGSAGKGSAGKGSVHKGSVSKTSLEKGSVSKGSVNKGIEDKGIEDKGIEDMGIPNKGIANEGIKNKGSKYKDIQNMRTEYEKGHVISARVLKVFIQASLDGKHARFLVSQKLPENWDEGLVKILVGNNFKSETLNPMKNVLVLFFNQKGASVDALAMYEKVADRLKDNKSIVFTKIDVNKNDFENFDIICPDIKMYRKGDNTVLDFEGPMMVDELIKFCGSVIDVNTS